MSRNAFPAAGRIRRLLSGLDAEAPPASAAISNFGNSPGAFWPFLIVLFAADAVLAHVGQDLPRRRQALWVDPLVGIPKIGAHDGARALEIDLVHGHDD